MLLRREGLTVVVPVGELVREVDRVTAVLVEQPFVDVFSVGLGDLVQRQHSTAQLSGATATMKDIHVCRANQST